MGKPLNNLDDASPLSCGLSAKAISRLALRPTSVRSLACPVSEMPGQNLEVFREAVDESTGSKVRYLRGVVPDIFGGQPAGLPVRLVVELCTPAGVVAADYLAQKCGTTRMALDSMRTFDAWCAVIGVAPWDATCTPTKAIVTDDESEVA